MGTRKTVRLSPHAGPLRRPAHLLTGAAVLAALALSGCTGSGSSFARGSATTAGATGSTGSTSTDQLESDYERVIADVLPSVVEIQSSTGLGSGVVYDDKGDVVTNAHVTGSDKQFQVLTSGSPGPLPATLVGSFPANDLAVIRVSGGQGLKPATFADSSKA